MKLHYAVIGSLGIIATALVFTMPKWNSSNSEGSYSKEHLSSLTPTSLDDAQAWLERRFRDSETGERISSKKLRQIDAAISQMEKSRAITFVEHGPDNIGGRTRAIQVDRINNNIIWAGGVSGGLFKSLNGANTWTHMNFRGHLTFRRFVSSQTELCL